MGGFEIIDEAILKMARACRDASFASAPADLIGLTMIARPEGYSEPAWKELTRAQQ